MTEEQIDVVILRQQNKQLREELAGAMENAEAIAVRLGVDCEEIDAAAMWHASVVAIVKLQGKLADADVGYGGWDSIRSRLEREIEQLREERHRDDILFRSVEAAFGCLDHSEAVEEPQLRDFVTRRAGQTVNELKQLREVSKMLFSALDYIEGFPTASEAHEVAHAALERYRSEVESK
jgi:hypothetical protein